MSEKEKIRKGKYNMDAAVSELRASIRTEVRDGKVMLNELSLYDKSGKDVFFINDSGEVFGYADENAKKMTPITEKDLKEIYYYW